MFKFQFHKGTIRTPTLERIAAALDDFNSIKVRLEHSYVNSQLDI